MYFISSYTESRTTGYTPANPVASGLETTLNRPQTRRPYRIQNSRLNLKIIPLHLREPDRSVGHKQHRFNYDQRSLGMGLPILFPILVELKRKKKKLPEKRYTPSSSWEFGSFSLDWNSLSCGNDKKMICGCFAGYPNKRDVSGLFGYPR